MSKPDKPISHVKDPVCGMVVTRPSAVADYHYRGRTYFFCAEVCRDAFAAEPEKYLSPPRRKRCG